MKTLYPEQIQTYIDQVTDAPKTIQKKLGDTTAALPQAIMQTPHDQTVLLATLVASMNAKKVIEVGVFTGYGTLAMAQAMPEDGKIIACENSNSWTEISTTHWKEAGVDHKIDLRLAPAIDTLNALIEGGQSNTFDFVYIDADKKGYKAYFEASLQLIRPNGLIALDNMLWRGQAADENTDENHAKVVRETALEIAEDKRVSKCMLPVGDGIYLLRKL